MRLERQRRGGEAGGGVAIWGFGLGQRQRARDELIWVIVNELF